MTRVLSGAVLAAVFFTVVWFANARVLAVVALVVGMLAFHEYAGLMRAIGATVSRPVAWVALLATIIVIPFPYAPVGIVLGLGFIAIAAAAMLRASTPPRAPAIDVDGAPSAGQGFGPADRGIVTGALAGGAAMIYLGIPLGALVAAHVYGGRGAVILLVATVAISDTAQYYAGRLLGRHSLAPRVSPKKTVEGAIGGFVAVPVWLYFAGPYFLPVAPPAMIASLGIVLVACGITGDLFESMMKRAADLKDSSALIPGHGGVLDRIDALLFAAPPYYLFVRWIYTP